jgi:hypothetical protein
MARRMNPEEPAICSAAIALHSHGRSAPRSFDRGQNGLRAGHTGKQQE